MIEREWLNCSDPSPMLAFLAGSPNDRKRRLFGVACCRRIWRHLSDASQAALLVLERFADGAATQMELEAAGEDAGRGARTADDEAVWLAAYSDRWNDTCDVAHASAGREVILGWPGRNDSNDEAYVAEQEFNACLLRELFGSLPFRPQPVAAAWLTSTVLALAQGIYEEHAFNHMPILADALQDAGCDNPDILAHCRQAGEHVRGCWVVDLLLGKE